MWFRKLFFFGCLVVLMQDQNYTVVSNLSSTKFRTAEGQNKHYVLDIVTLNILKVISTLAHMFRMSFYNFGLIV